MQSRRKARVIAFQSLFEYECSRIALADALQFRWMSHSDQESATPELLDFASMLVVGTREHLEPIDSAIATNLRGWQIDRLAKADLANLRIAVFQLLFANDIPARVVIDEAVGIAKTFASDGSYKFINGVLDSVGRQAGRV